MRRLVPFVFIITLLLTYPLLLLVRSESTEIQVPVPVKVIGIATPVQVVARNPHGLRRVEVVIEQSGKLFTVFEQHTTPRRWSLFRRTEAPQLYSLQAGTKAAPGLHDGRAVLRIDATANDLRAKTDSFSIEVDVNTKPPTVSVDEGQHYINLGGSEAVAFTAAGYWTEAGVRVGKYTFRSFPLPGAGSPNRRICLFAYPYDTPEGTVPIVYVRNPAGTEATARFWNKITWKKFRMREIIISDAFLNKVFTELDPGGSGNPVARFTKINSDMRQANIQTLAALRDKTADKVLWNGPFLQLANSTVEAQFCDYRKYFYHGQDIDQQVHLGFDLAVTAQTPVSAANDGRVVYTGKLGIYGNAIVIDHGLGLQSLYAHLSEIQTTVGAEVKKGQVIGKSGATGMAGGDHLHFGMQLDGASVNPIEWWDAHWIHDRILSRLR